MRLSDSELSFHSQQNFLKYTHSSAPPPAKNNLLESGVESPRFFGIQNVIYFATSYCFNERLKTIHVKSDHCRQNILSDSKPIPFASRSSPLTAFCRHA